MNISIEYCSIWNYLPNASRLEAEIKEEFPASKIELISSGGGIFEIKIGNDVIFSKKSARRFPEPGEISSLIREH